MLIYLRNLLLKIALPVTKMIGKISLPYVDKKVCGKDYDTIFNLMQDGDILLSHSSGHLTNLFIPGFWKHASIVSGFGVIEAVGDGVQRSSLFDFVHNKDYLCLLRPLFLTKSEACAAAFEANALIDFGYDYFFDKKNKLFYCSELPTFCYAKVKPGNPFTRIWQESTQTVTVFPRDFYDAKSKFEVIYCNK